MKKTMKLWDIVLMNVTAVIGLRWITIAASFGAASIFMWIFAACMFFIPLGLVSSELATTWPDEGGIYIWVKEAFGEKPAFITSWYYWVNNLFYYPSLLTFIAVTLSFVINPALKDNKIYVCAVILIIFWSVTLINCKGLSIGKWLSNTGGLFGTILPGIIIMVLGIASVFIWKRPIPTNYSFSNWIPHISGISNISMMSSLMFAMVGIEMTPILAGETHNPQKTFPRAIFISAIFVAGIYILGTVAVTMIISPDKIGQASGILDAIKLLAGELNIPWLTTLVALLLVIGTFGGVSVWIVGPIKLLFESTKKGVLPESFTKLNENDMPQNAMIIQACIVTGIVLLTSFLPSVNTIYSVLVLMTTMGSFIPYVFMFTAFIKLRKTQPDKHRPYKVPGGKTFAYIITVLAMIAVAVGLFLPLVPSSDLKTTADVVIYELEIICGPLLFGLVGLLFYTNYERKQKKALTMNQNK